MMTGEKAAVVRRISRAQNGEDVRVWRALRDVQDVFYVEVGASDPFVDSLTAALSAEGAHGVLVEADPEVAEVLRQARPRDVVVAAAASSASGVITFHELDRRGWGTVAASRIAEAEEHVVRRRAVPAVRLDDVLSDLEVAEVHFLSVDVEGHEAAVLAGAGLARHRPWILCVEAVRPQSRTPSWAEWEPEVLGAGYSFVTFDGLNRWFVAEERAELSDVLAQPFGVLDRLLDGWIPAEVAELEDAARQAERDQRNLERTVMFVEGLVAHAEAEAEQVRQELARETARLQGEAEAAAQATAQAAAEVARVREEAQAAAAASAARHAEQLHAEQRRAAAAADAVRDELTARLAQAEAATAHLASSRSWRYTRPMRELLHAVSSRQPRTLPVRARARTLSVANTALSQHPEVRAALLERLSKVPGATHRLRAWQVAGSAVVSPAGPAAHLHQTADARLRTAASSLIDHYGAAPTPRQV